MTRLYAYILLATTLIATVSCEHNYSLKAIKATPKVVVYCFPSTADTTWISVSKSIPVQEKMAYTPIGALANTRITYKVNGIEKPVHNFTDGLYFVLGAQKPGDEVTLSVIADGLHEAHAATAVPASRGLNIDNITPVSIADEDGNFHEAYRIRATLTDAMADKDYFAVQVKVKYVFGSITAYYKDKLSGFPDQTTWTTLEDCQDYLREHGITPDSMHVRRTDSTFHKVNVYYNSEPILAPMSAIDSDLGFSKAFYNDFYVFSGVAASGIYTLHLDVEPEEMETLSCEYCVELYKLTPEYYRFVKSVNDAKNNELGAWGLSQVTPTHTNIIGGIGLMGGYNVAQSNWIPIDNTKQDYLK